MVLAKCLACRLFYLYDKTPRRHQTALRDQALTCSHARTAFLHFPSKGHLEVSVPETSPCHVQAKQIGELDPRRVSVPTAAVFFAPRVQKLRRIESGARWGRRRSLRIGSVSRRLCTWAASGGLVTFESIGHRREGQSNRVRSSLGRTGTFAGSRPRFWLLVALALLCLS